MYNYKDIQCAIVIMERCEERMWILREAGSIKIFLGSRDNKGLPIQNDDSNGTKWDSIFRWVVTCGDDF